MSPETAVRETLPAPQCCSRTFVELYEKRRFLRKLRTANQDLIEKAGHCKKVYRLFKIHRNAVAKIVPAHRLVRLSLKREVL
jgi:hypothetical protein